MTRCRVCRQKFPSQLVTQMCINGDYLLCCPICALSIRNTMLGLPLDEPFQGEMAAAMYDDAVEFLRQKDAKA